MSALSDATGAYRLANFPSQRVIVNRDGYETQDVPPYATDHADVNIRLQRTMSVAVGETIAAILFRDDPIYGAALGGEGPGCHCKRIRIQMPHAGMLEVDVRTTQPLSLWIGTSRTNYAVNAPVRVKAAAGEVVIYVGVDWFDGPDVGDAPFQLTTAYLN